MKWRYRTYRASIAMHLCLTLLAISSGCATHAEHRAMMEDIRRHVKTIAVVHSTAVPKRNYKPEYAKGKDAGEVRGALHGAGKGFLDSFNIMTGKGGEIGVLLWPIVAPISTIVGAAKGSEEGVKKAVPSEDVDEIEALLTTATSSVNIQEKLAEHIVSSGSNMTSRSFTLEKSQAQDGPFEMAIETKVTSLGFLGGTGANPKVSFYVIASVRTARPQDGHEIYQRELRHESEAKYLSTWNENHGAAVTEELEKAFRNIAERSTEDIFFGYNTHMEERRCFAERSEDKVTLYWESFLGHQDRAAKPEVVPTTQEDVTYDVRYWPEDYLPGNAARILCDVSGLRPPDICAELRDVKVTEHARNVSIAENVTNSVTQTPYAVMMTKTVVVAEPVTEIRLRPKMSYFCSIRANYALNGEARLPSWSPDSRFTAPEYKKFTQAVYTRAEQVLDRTFYTRSNIWYERPDRIQSTNYHRGAILPIGTKIKITAVSDKDPISHIIRFKDEAGTSYTLGVHYTQWERYATPWDFIGLYFVENDPLEEGGAIRALSEEEQKNVMHGTVERGMSKAAVLVAFGYPPGDKTPSLEQDQWTYWMTDLDTRTITFQDDRVISVGP